MNKFLNRLFRKKKVKFWQRKPKKFMSRKHLFSKKNKNDSVKKLKRGLFAILIFIIIYFVFFSKFFIIEETNISGNKTISREGIEKIIENENSNKALVILSRKNFFLSDKDKLREKLLNEFPEIETIMIKKKFPNTLEIEITEKNPLILWCRTENCYYLDLKGIAFMTEDNGMEIYKDKKFIKIIEKIKIKEEIEDKLERERERKAKEATLTPSNDIQNLIDSEISDDPEDKEEDKEKDIILEPIKINDKVADEDFINFVFELDNNIRNDTDLKIKYYKTKGAKTREIIAYTNKNIRIYFNTIDNAKTQTTYLKDFISIGIGKNEINTLEYIYLKSGNKIFYK
ncbi:MAG: FtsQ-type POTRA domain-containing protein [Patescibacteria group bacterium]|nr:FtsQ-type POTRA domain-containing protein [Patescibacteria group bacterium]